MEPRIKKNKNALSYSEQQAFNQWWLFILLCGINVVFVVGCIKQLGFGISWGNNPMSNTVLIIYAVFFFFFSLWFLRMRLRTEIDSEGIQWKFFLLEFKAHFLSWDEIEDYEVSKYKPLSFGGWGIKSSQKTKVYSTSGNYALKLKLKNGRYIYIGTQNPEELKDVLNKIHVSG